MFYTFSQNNSGSSIKGTAYIVIEADSATKANSLAEDRGVYFDGCISGYDCSCCGDRWYPVDDYDATETPTYSSYDLSLPREEFLATYGASVSKYAYRDFDVDIYYLDGSKHELRIPVEELKEIADEHKKAQPSRWGFSWYPKWDEPSEVTQVFLGDHGWWYDLEGNFSLDIDPRAKKKVNSKVSEHGIYNWYGENKDDLDALRAKFIVSLSDLRDSLLQCIDDSTADADVKAIFVKKVGGYE